MQPEVASEPVHALPRISMDGQAARLQPESAHWLAAHQIYLTRFPEAEPMTHLGDFSFVAIYPTAARQVAGFGTARPLEADELAEVLRAVPG